jgi:alkylation response protein AidB-like acyl-CoA dehydrogenase
VLDLVVAIEESGRGLLPDTLASSSLVATSLLVDGAPQAGRPHLPGLAEGRMRACLVDEGMRARQVSEGFVVSGSASTIRGADTADILLVVCRDPDVIVVVDRASPGVSVHPRRCFDTTRRTAEVIASDVAVAPHLVVARGPEAVRLIGRAERLGCLAIAADAVGGALGVIEIAVDYAKVRQQFGRSIGSFQAVKHPLVDAYVAAEIASSLVYDAARSIDANESDRRQRLAVAAAKGTACEAYMKASIIAVQTHGGLGFTKDVAAYLYLQRAKADERLHGRPRDHFVAIGELLTVETEDLW